MDRLSTAERILELKDVMQIEEAATYSATQKVSSESHRAFYFEDGSRLTFEYFNGEFLGIKLIKG